MSSILIIEDHAVIREPLVIALQTQGYEVRGAADGATALKMCKDRIPDLILLDLALPDMDGVSILREFRAMNGAATIPVIVLTATPEKSLLTEAIRLGVSSILLKSRFSLRSLLEIVAQKIAGTKADSPQAKPPTQSAQSGKSSTPLPQSAKALGTSRMPVRTAQKIGSLDDVKPLMVRSKLLEHIDQCGELKGFSPAIHDVLTLTGSSQCSMEDVARAISRDHSIAIKVLRLANSAIYSRGEPVDNVQKAVQRIGLSQIRQAVLNLAVVDHFCDNVEGFIDGGQFWEHSIATGLIAAEIARHLQQPEPELAFTCGLLHDIGRMVMVAQLGEEYQAVLQTARDLHLQLDVVEKRMLGGTHADVMDRVFRSWKFSKEIIVPIAFHHTPVHELNRVGKAAIQQTATIILADRLAHSMLLGASGHEFVHPTEELCALLKLRPEVINTVEQGLREQTDQVKFSLLARNSRESWPQLREVHRSALKTALRPLYISPTSEFDSFRILVRQLSEPEGSGTTNIGIVQWQNAREQATIASAFLAEERQNGLQNLPLVMITPLNDGTPEAQLVANRSSALLTTPVDVRHLVAAIADLLQSSHASVAA